MALRPYDSSLRLRKQAELKTRIAASAAALHARKGVSGTSYADIAAEAGVSAPTVYAHFPTQDELLAGCTTHVASTAPVVPVDDILASPNLATAADRLAGAMEQRHLHFEPWLAWREDRVIPFLAELSGEVRHEVTRLVARVLERFLGPGDRRHIAAGWETLLSFDAWHRLARGHKLPRAAVRQTIVNGLLALASQPPSSMRPKPRKKR